MSLYPSAESLMVQAVAAGIGVMPWRLSLNVGAALGDAVRIAGMRRAVAAGNLAQAFPEWSLEERERVLADHYRELGRVACEYVRLPELAHAAPGEVIAQVHGMEHLIAAHDAGRGALLVTGHFGNFELGAAYLGRRHPVDMVVKPLANPGVQAWIAERRRRAGVGMIPLGAGVRRVFEALRQNRWVALLADQDAKSRGVFVPFLGRPSSTPVGPAEIALRTGAPLIMGFMHRRADGRHELEVLPPLLASETDGDPALLLTARHAACLEAWIRRHPANWLWLHRRWKSAPPAAESAGAA